MGKCSVWKPVVSSRFDRNSSSEIAQKFRSPKKYSLRVNKKNIFLRYVADSKKYYITFLCIFGFRSTPCYPWDTRQKFRLFLPFLLSFSRILTFPSRLNMADGSDAL